MTLKTENISISFFFFSFSWRCKITSLNICYYTGDPSGQFRNEGSYWEFIWWQVTEIQLRLLRNLFGLPITEKELLPGISTMWLLIWGCPFLVFHIKDLLCSVVTSSFGRIFCRSQGLLIVNLSLAIPTERKLFLNGCSEHLKADSHWPGMDHMLMPETINVTGKEVPSLARPVLISRALVEHGDWEGEKDMNLNMNHMDGEQRRCGLDKRKLVCWYQKSQRERCLVGQNCKYGKDIYPHIL